MTEPRNRNDELIYMDEVTDEASQPLTPKLEAIIRPRSNSMLEADNINNPRETSATEAEDLEPDVKPSIVSEYPGVDDGLLPVVPVGSIPSSRNSIFPLPPIQPTPDVNIYQHKKTLAQGMMDLALLSANANQLRYVLQTDGGHPYYYPSLAMIGASLFLQIAVGIGLIWNSRYNVKNNSEMCKAERANNWTVIGIFLVTILNVFISSFGVIDQVIQCIPGYPHSFVQKGKLLEQFPTILNNSEGSRVFEEIIDESGERLNLEKRFRRNASRNEDKQRSSPRPTQSDIRFVFPEEINTAVPTCKGSTYCETVSSYPEDVVNRAIQRNESIKYYEGVDVIDDSIDRRLGETDDIPLCMSIEHVIFPQSAKNKENEWKFIANQENLKQGVRIEKCRKENASCSSIGGLAEGYRTNCKQKYVYRQLASVMADGSVVPDTFRFPSSCCCHVFFNGNVLTRMGVNIVDQQSQVTPVKTRKRK